MLKKCLALICVLMLLPLGALMESVPDTLVGTSYAELEAQLGKPVYQAGLGCGICVWHTADRVIVCMFRWDGPSRVMDGEEWKQYDFVSEYAVFDWNKKLLAGTVEPELDTFAVVWGLKLQDEKVMARSVDVGSGLVIPAMISSDGMIVTDYGLLDTELVSVFTLQ